VGIQHISRIRLKGGAYKKKNEKKYQILLGWVWAKKIKKKHADQETSPKTKNPFKLQKKRKRDCTRKKKKKKKKKKIICLTNRGKSILKRNIKKKKPRPQGP